MTKELLIYVNGEFVPISKPCIMARDHGLLYGDGIFEGIRQYNGRVFKLQQHIDRLFDSAKMINLDIGKTKEEIMDAVENTLFVNELHDAYIRLVVTRGDGDLGLDPRNCPHPTIMIIAQPMAPIADPKGIKAITTSIRRVPASVFSPNIKSLNYLNNILAKAEATRQGVGEAIFLNMEGFVCEGSAENIFMVKDNKLITPPHILSLRGITRETILTELGYEITSIEDIDVRNISIYELYAADEVFMTGTAAELAPVIEIDGRKIGDGKPGDITLRLQKLYKEYVNTGVLPSEYQKNMNLLININ